MVKVAVVTRTKDRSLFLKRALSSVQAQKFTDYIHVIVNDGGEKTEVDEIVAALSDVQRSKTEVFHRDTASGAPDTIFNESINRIVDSEYFAIHDDDDTWHPEFLQQTVDYLDNHPDEAAVVVAADKIIETVSDNQILQKKKQSWMPDMQAISLYRQFKDNQFTPIATLFRRTTYDKIGGFDDTLPVIGDWEFGIRLLMNYDAGFINPGFALANYHHRKVKDNSFSRHNHRKYVTLVANRYLRDELQQGKLGAGYIISSLKYDEDVRHHLIKKILPASVINRIRNR